MNCGHETCTAVNAVEMSFSANVGTCIVAFIRLTYTEQYQATYDNAKVEKILYSNPGTISFQPFPLPTFAIPTPVTLWQIVEIQMEKQFALAEADLLAVDWIANVRKRAAVIIFFTS